MATITLIAAIGKNNELGLNNNLIWHLKEDLKFFKEQTIDKKIILGRKTLESLPNGRLPRRTHLVLTHQDMKNSTDIYIYNNIEDLLDYLKGLDEEVMVIGGAKVYEEFLPYATKLILTEIDSSAKADVYFPKINKEDWERKLLSTYQDNNLIYHHVLYKRK